MSQDITNISTEESQSLTVGKQTVQDAIQRVGVAFSNIGNALRDMLGAFTIAVQRLFVATAQLVDALVWSLVNMDRKLMRLPVARAAIRYTHVTVSTWDCSKWALTKEHSLVMASTLTYKPYLPTDTSWRLVTTGRPGHVSHKLNDPIQRSGCDSVGFDILPYVAGA